MNTFPMTAAGHSVLEYELERRIRIERPQLLQRIQQAILDDSNLAEMQEANEARIAELLDKLARAGIDVSKLSGATVKFGATVRLVEEDTGAKKVWPIVGEPEADALKGKISVNSPIASALIGKTKGASVEVEAPNLVAPRFTKYTESSGARTPQ